MLHAVGYQEHQLAAQVQVLQPLRLAADLGRSPHAHVLHERTVRDHGAGAHAGAHRGDDHRAAEGELGRRAELDDAAELGEPAAAPGEGRGEREALPAAGDGAVRAALAGGCGVRRQVPTPWSGDTDVRAHDRAEQQVYGLHDVSEEDKRF